MFNINYRELGRSMGRMEAETRLEGMRSECNSLLLQKEVEQLRSPVPLISMGEFI